MPFGDGTGPQGMGPMTGRGHGYCTGSVRTGFAGTMVGRGWFNFTRTFGRGVNRSIGRGPGRRRYSPYPDYYRW